MTQGQMPPGQQHQQQPNAVLEVKPSFIFLAFLLFFFKPMISINGSQPMKGVWGVNRYPVAPGRYRVEVWVPYLFFSNMGRNAIGVEVPHGAAVQVTWRAPLTVFSQGKMNVLPPTGIDAGPQGQQGHPGQGQQGHPGQGQQGHPGQVQQGQGHLGQGQLGQGHPGQAQPGYQQGGQQSGQQGQSQQPSAHQGGQPSGQQSAQPGGQVGGQAGGQAAGWHADPSHRYELRYWDGARWTEHVSSGGVQSTDRPA